MTTENCNSKITARIDDHTYEVVMGHFHHGQQTLFLRKLFDSIKKLIEQDKFGEVADYLYKETDLTLPGK
jgi:hypothetical protein